jgi:hypothetical protein
VRKLLILLGAARYPYKRELALSAFKPSHDAFLSAMTRGDEPIVGGEDVLDLFDTDDPWFDQQLRINSWLKDRAPPPGDPRALLIYYVGHGGLADDGSQFFMAINSTNDFDALASSISRDSFTRTLNRAARLFRKYLIIDCCFAANVIAGMQGAVAHKMTAELNEVDSHMIKDHSSGLAAICSSDSISTSNALGRDGLTQFTDALLETMRLGDPNGEDELTFENLRLLIEPQLKRLYGDRAVPPASRFDDNVRGPIHKLGLFPNRAQRGAARPAATQGSATASERNVERFDVIRKATGELGRVFSAHPKTGVPPAKLQHLAKPIAAAARSLTNLAIVDELLDVTGDQRNAAIFAAAVIIYQRAEHDYFDRLVAVATDGRKLRGAPMWRVLRAIKRLCSGVKIDGNRRQALVAAMRNLASNYDTTMHERFKARDIVLLVAQTASLKALKIDLERDKIFSAPQLADWARFETKDRPALQPLPVAVPTVTAVFSAQAEIPRSDGDPPFTKPMSADEVAQLGAARRVLIALLAERSRCLGGRGGSEALQSPHDGNRALGTSCRPGELREHLRRALFQAMKEGDKQRVAAVRLILARLIDRDVAQRTAVESMDDHTLVIGTLQQMAKNHRESIVMHQQSRREDLAAIERYELAVIEEFLAR